MTNLKTVESWALHAYVDGELDAVESANVERLLAEDSAARLAVDAYRRQKEAMKQAYNGVLTEPLPRSMQAALAARGSWRGRPYAHMAAALALLLIGGMAGWFAAYDPAGNTAMSFADNALIAHAIYAAEVKHPVEVPASEKNHLEAWLSKRVGTHFIVPDLTAEGYNLLGGRLLASEDRPAAQLMYEDASKRRVTIYLTAITGKPETGLRVEKRGPLIACYWLDGRLAFAMTGDMDEAPMMQLARIVYDKFEG